jgi:hypothetical protein
MQLMNTHRDSCSVSHVTMLMNLFHASVLMLLSVSVDCDQRSKMPHTGSKAQTKQAVDMRHLPSRCGIFGLPRFRPCMAPPLRIICMPVCKFSMGLRLDFQRLSLTMASLSQLSNLSLTGVFCSTLLLHVINQYNDPDHLANESRLLPLSIYTLGWLLGVACHFHGLVSDTAARILICQMGAVHVNIWRQWWTEPEQTPSEYLARSIWCAHIGMIIGLLWTWRMGGGKTVK